MAVIHCKEVSGRSGSGDLDTNHRYTRAWQVITDDPQDGAKTVIDHPGIPDYGDVYRVMRWDPVLEVFTADVVEEDVNAVVVSKRVTHDDPDNPNNWRVEVEYAGVDDPTAQPAEVEFEGVIYAESYIEDTDGKKVENSAGDPFESGLVRDQTRFVLTIAQNVLDGDWDPIAAEQYKDTLNEDPFLVGYFLTSPGGFPPGTCKLSRIGALRIRRSDNQTFYWRRRVVIDIDSRGWTQKVRDAGFHELGPVTGKRRKIYTGPGEAASTPQLLNGEGARLQPGDPVPDPLEFKPYRTKEWAALQLEY